MKDAKGSGSALVFFLGTRQQECTEGPHSPMPASSKRLVDYMLHLLSVALTAIMKPTRIIFLGCTYLPPTEASACDSCKLHQSNLSLGSLGIQPYTSRPSRPRSFKSRLPANAEQPLRNPEQDPPPIKPLSSPKPQSRSRASEGF